MLEQLQLNNDGNLGLNKKDIERYIHNAERHMSIPYFDSVSRKKRGVTPGLNNEDPIGGWGPMKEGFILDEDQPLREKRSPAAETLGSTEDQICFDHHKNDIGMIMKMN